MNGPQTQTEELNELRTQLRELGATEQEIDLRLQHMSPDDDFDVYAENWNAIVWFNDVYQLLHVVGNRYMGIDVCALEADARMSGRSIDPSDYKRLRTLARFVSKELNTKTEAQ